MLLTEVPFGTSGFKVTISSEVQIDLELVNEAGFSIPLENYNGMTIDFQDDEVAPVMMSLSIDQTTEHLLLYLIPLQVKSFIDK